MKFTTILASLFLLASVAQAKHYNFSYAQGKLRITKEAASWKEAYDKAAHECFNHFTGAKDREKVQISRNVATDIIDICANPRRG